MKWNALIAWRLATRCAVGLMLGIVGAGRAADNASNSSGSAKEVALPALTTAEQVHRLTREQATAELRAVIRGVVTCPLPQYEAVVIQDSTRGVYVSHISPSLGEPPGLGELVEIEGVSNPGEFAPRIEARRVRRLGAGTLPQPVRSAWDQLINGSLDTQYVEVEGVVISVRADEVTLLTLPS